MSVRFIACALALGVVAATACGNDDPGHSQDDGGAGESAGGSAGESAGGAANSGGSSGSGARAGGAAGADGGEGGSAGGCGEESCACSPGERGCPCSESDDCAGGLTCHPELGCANVCVAPDDGFWVIEDARALSDLLEQECDAIDGSLWLLAPDVDDIGGLESLKVVSGDVTISGAERLSSLVGFTGLETIGGSLVVQANTLLRDLGGLEALRSIGQTSDTGALVVSENDALTSIAALAAADVSGLSITVTGNPELARVAGLGNARALENVVIADNERLESLNGLAAVAAVENFTVADNPALPDVNLPALERLGALTLTGNTRMAQLRLPALESVEMTLTVASNLVLENVEMPALESVGGSVTISANPELSRLEFAALASVGALTVAGNASLPQCEVDALNARLGNPCGTNCSGNDERGVCP